MTEDQYRSLATDYHWYFDDVALFLGSDTPGVRAAMSSLELGACVLDAACGIGVDATALVRRGFNVTASDASTEMVAVTRHRLEAAGVDRSDVITSTWADLPTKFEPERFDAIFCTGNSIAHAPDAEAAIDAFKAFRSILTPGGILVLDTHDWELVHEMGSRVEIEPDIVERNGTRCVRTYSWHVPEAFGDPHLLEIAPIFIDGNHATLRSYPVTMWPFTRAELNQRLRTAGFTSVALDAIPGDERYTATARRPKPKHP
ncbi:MAG: class I SAM-dependent methyltransferase [Ilumatobacter sp.]|jgi:SAM-dependent methyltransferase|uniref:class I SAM-dependent methyltransferase n=1 Tax=Ilumatobacter sp. TaxID=1967498 RepID=UPI001D49538F|nr:class I SAM-dependent methyltransferase [Ilumatobacter sp.]MBT5276002.1 class I SAM-dependent methyltransferase [Ilumatobacter sp.]MBT5555160.1 class I SAM-dependent methyltransferase [Ilumatobacter sp.]MBT5866637.1 class I SAM-dependent methyltransferase [Ilumatobacter sp.]